MGVLFLISGEVFLTISLFLKQLFCLFNTPMSDNMLSYSSINNTGFVSLNNGLNEYIFFKNDDIIV